MTWELALYTVLFIEHSNFVFTSIENMVQAKFNLLKLGKTDGVSVKLLS